MACEIIPTIINSEGERTPSLLYKDLLKVTKDRDSTNYIYNRVHHSTFLREHRGAKLDKNGLPTLEYLLSNFNFDDLIDNIKLESYIAKKMGLEIYENSDSKKCLAKAAESNLIIKESDSSMPYISYVEQTESGPKVTFAINTDFNNRLFKLLLASIGLNEKLRDILNKNGISVGIITALEELDGVDGITDFECNKKVAEGSIEMIRIARGEVGENALSEEFCHVLIRGLANSTPLIGRLKNLLDNDELIDTIIGDNTLWYRERYDTNRDLLIEEAAGLLLNLVLRRTDGHLDVAVAERLGTYMKNLFKNVSSSEIRNALQEALAIASDLSTMVVDRPDAVVFSPNTKILGGRLAAKAKELAKELKKEITLQEEVVLRMISLVKELALRILNIKGIEPLKVKDAKRLRWDLERLYNAGKQVDAVYTYLQNAAKILLDYAAILNDVTSNPKLTAMEKVNLCNDVRLSLMEVESLLGSVDLLLYDDELHSNIYSLGPNRQAELEIYKGKSKAYELVSNMHALNNQLLRLYYVVAKDLYCQAATPYISKTMLKGNEFGPDAKEMTPEEILFHAKNDLNGINRWVESLANSGIQALQIFDEVYKSALDKKRRKVIDFRLKLATLALEAEKAGIKDFSWMFETTKDGKKTGKYISKYNMALYVADRTAFLESIKDKTQSEKILLSAKWTREHTSNGYPSDEYLNKDYATIMKENGTRKKFLEGFLELKKLIDVLLPTSSSSNLDDSVNNIVCVRKELLERIKDSSKLNDTNLAKEIVKGLNDAIRVRSDDTEFGEMQYVNGKKETYDRIPIYFTHIGKGESYDDLSEDVVSSLMAYANMGYNYSEMNKVLGFLLMGKDFIDNDAAIVNGKRIFSITKETHKTELEKEWNEKFKFWSLDKGDTSKQLDVSKSKIKARLDDWFLSLIFMRYCQGDLGDISADKLAGILMKYTGLRDLGFSLHNAISNVATGVCMMNVETAFNKYFKPKDLVNADKLYTQWLGSYISEVGSRTKTNMLSLLDDLFNILDEYEENANNWEWFKKSKLMRLAGSESLMFLMNGGEHWMSMRTFLAYANSITLTNKNTKETKKLLDCFKKVTLALYKLLLADAYRKAGNASKAKALEDEIKAHPEWTNNKVLKLVLDGLYTLNGEDFTEESMRKIASRVKNINHSLHGIYNKEDSAAIQRVWYGKLAMQYRKWMKPNWDKRFASKKYNNDLDDVNEGWYHCAGVLMKHIAMGAMLGKNVTKEEWNNLSEDLKALILKAGIELFLIAALCIMLALVDFPDDDDSLLTEAVRYLAYRLRSELAMMVPIPIWYSESHSFNIPVVTEMMNLVKTPVISERSAEHLVKMINVVNPFFYLEAVTVGAYKGHSKAFKLWCEAIPGLHAWYVFLNSKQATTFYTSGR